MGQRGVRRGNVKVSSAMDNKLALANPSGNTDSRAEVRRALPPVPRFPPLTERVAYVAPEDLHVLGGCSRRLRIVLSDGDLSARATELTAALHDYANSCRYRKAGMKPARVLDWAKALAYFAAETARALGAIEGELIGIKGDGTPLRQSLDYDLMKSAAERLGIDPAEIEEWVFSLLSLSERARRMQAGESERQEWHRDRFFRRVRPNFEVLHNKPFKKQIRQEPTEDAEGTKSVAGGPASDWCKALIAHAAKVPSAHDEIRELHKWTLETPNGVPTAVKKASQAPLLKLSITR